MMNSGTCHYGVLARLYVEEDEWCEEEEFSQSCFKSSKKTPYRADKDLLLALGDAYLFVLRRKQPQIRACVCLAPHELTLDASTQQRLASNFQCPHVGSYDEYEQWAAIDYASIVHVQLTFRTLSAPGDSGKGSGLAARTKDCLVVVRDGSKLWVEFEHNSARGAFLDALMAASAPHVTLDLDYADLANLSPIASSLKSPRDVEEPPDNQGSSRMVFEFQRAASRLAVMLALELDAEDLDVALYGQTEHDAVAIQGLSSTYTSSDQPQLSFDFRRTALRHAVEAKVLLALQLSSEVELDDPHCHFLLATAMELARAMDEPDLHALTWLVSGFINLQRAVIATTVGSTSLAQSQLEHAVKLAREHSLRLQLALALACCGDLHRLSTDQFSLAGSLLVEAAKLMPPNALDVTGKMLLHNKIHQLGLAVSPRSAGATQDKNVIDLWKALSSAMSTPSISHSDRFQLLRPVFKSRTDRSHFCFVEVHAAMDDNNAPKTTRLRVYFTEQTTFQWLRDEIAFRCNAVPVVDSEADGATTDVVGFYDSTAKSPTMIPWSTRVSDVVRIDWHVVHAVVHQTTSEPEQPKPATPRPAKPAAVMVRCSKCRCQLPLSQAEAHSEVCSI